MDITMLVGILVLALVLVGAWLLVRRRQSHDLEKRFGPEYHHVLDEQGSRRKAEAELLARQRRVDKLQLVRLPPEQAARFAEEWRLVQARFVDNPKGVLMDADALVNDLMRRRGYPMGDFDSRAADISVDHPAVVHHYRAARDIARRDQRGEADTEALRQAVVHYRALFSELLEVEETHEPVPQRPAEGRLRRDPSETGHSSLEKQRSL